MIHRVSTYHAREKMMRRCPALVTPSTLQREDGWRNWEVESSVVHFRWGRSILPNARRQKQSAIRVLGKTFSASLGIIPGCIFLSQ